MNCLCCGKPISENASAEELRMSWHSSCVRSFFGTRTLPFIDLSEELLEKLAEQSVNRGLTVPGVQKKISLHLTQGDQPRLTLIDYPAGYILKPQTEEYEQLPEAEYLTMRMAERCGISVVPFAMITLGKPEQNAYITKRIDRRIQPASKRPVQKFAMEDFCQLDNRSSLDKYRGSYERCGKIIKHYSCREGLDISEFFARLVFSFIVGNSDMHLKNFSLIETEPGSGDYVLSPAYDMLPVNIILPADKDETALTLNGKKMHLRRNDFLALAENLEITRKAALNLIEHCLAFENTFIELCEDSRLSETRKAALAELIAERARILKG